MPSMDVGVEVRMKPRPELLTMRAVVGPFAGYGDPFPGGDRRGMSDDRHQVAMAARLDPQNAKAVLGIMERDALDQAGEDFADS